MIPRSRASPSRSSSASVVAAHRVRAEGAKAQAADRPATAASAPSGGGGAIVVGERSPVGSAPAGWAGALDARATGASAIDLRSRAAHNDAVVRRARRQRAHGGRALHGARLLGGGRLGARAGRRGGHLPPAR